MFPRRGISLVLSVLLGAAGLVPGAASAQRSGTALKVFTNAPLGYSLSYPATWRRLPSTNLDVSLQAPDARATLGGKGINGGASSTVLRQALDNTIELMGASVGKIVRTTRVIHGVRFQEDQTTSANVHGVKEAAMVIGASQHQRTYLFFGIVALEKPAAHVRLRNAQGELTQIQASLDSITIAR
ncbi:MAG: hypothetical protein ACRDGS_15990 [Chloroflexota bacterium]